jgi:Uma2 family endonuclease
MRVAEAVPSRLENGAVMGREEFHRLYSECAGTSRIELIEGVVFMPSPISTEGHADQQGLLIEWLAAYAARRPGVKWSPPASILLDDANEPEPDAMLYRTMPGRFEDGFLVVPPELVIEIANTSASRDLHQKKRAYERNGILEYIVWRVQDRAIDWFALDDGTYRLLPADSRGVVESRVFPGLCLDVGAALALNRDRVLAALANL